MSFAAYLNGVFFGFTDGLRPGMDLRQVDEVAGMPICVSEDVHPGTLELWQDGRRVAVVEGIGPKRPVKV